MTDITHGFRDIDSQANPDHFASYLGDLSDRLAGQKEEAIGILRPSPGAKLLDVGCGPGHDVQRVAELVGSSGLAVGVDRSRAMIDAARRASIRGSSARFTVGDAHTLPFPNDSFDGARADRTLQHVDNPPAVLKEMLRVVRPRGRIVVTEPDWGSLMLQTSNPAAELQVVEQLRDLKSRHGRIGRELLGHFVQLGLCEIVILPFTLVIHRLDTAATVLRLADVASQELLDELAQRDDAGTFFAAVTGFTVGGVVP